MFDRVPTDFSRWVGIELAALLVVGALIFVYSRVAPPPDAALSAAPVQWVPAATAAPAAVGPTRAAGPEGTPRPPQPTPVPPAATAAPTGPKTHIVQPGETLSQIAAKYEVSAEAIIKASNLEDPNSLKVEQELTIPAPGAPPATPAATAAPAAAPAAPTAPAAAPVAAGPAKHKVAAGDTLNSIAQKYNTTLEALIKANNLDNADDLRLDQELVIP